MARRLKQNKLRKQPKRRRTYASSAVQYPQLNVPETARKRRRRQKTEGVRFGLTALKRFLFSSRWISLGLLGLTIFALVIIFQERRFYLTYIPVDGAISLSSEEIVAASNLAGSHVFSANPSQAAENITALPGVISSTVTLQWPNQVLIEISEEQPVAVWQENGTSYGITGSGRLMPVNYPLTGLLQIIPEKGNIATNPTPPVDTDTEEEAAAAEEAITEETMVEETVVEETASEEPTQEESTPADASQAAAQAPAGTNQDAQTSPEAGDEAIATSLSFVPQEVLLGALSLRQLRPSINELYYRPSDGLSFQDGRGWRVHFGTGNDMNQKLVLYETILNDLLTRGINPQYISVGNKSKPYYRAQ